MPDTKTFAWLDLHVPDASETKVRELCRLADKKKLPGWKKNAVVNFILLQQKEEKKAGDSAAYFKELRSLLKSKEYKEVQGKVIKEDKAKFTMSGIVIAITATLILFFVTAVLTQSFMINFSVDAIVGAIALVFCYRNMKIKYRLLKRYDQGREYLYMDIASVVLSFMLKVWFLHGFDLSLLILFVSYYIQKRKLDRVLSGLE